MKKYILFCGHKIKITKLYQVSKAKYGRVIPGNKKPGYYENDMASCLCRFGFNVEILTPSNIAKSKNPDICMLGTFWEIKTLFTANQNTIKTHFRKALKQANGKAVFDLRYYNKNPAEVKRYILELFATMRGMRRVILIEYDQKMTTIAIDLIK